MRSTYSRGKRLKFQHVFFFQLQMRVIHWFTECWTITDVVWHIDLHPINHQAQWGQRRFEVVLEPQTCSRLQVFVILYLLFWPAFNWRIFFGEEKFTCMPSKDKVADESLYFQRHTHTFSRQIAMFSFFIGHFVFRRLPTEKLSNESRSK